MEFRFPNYLSGLRLVAKYADLRHFKDVKLRLVIQMAFEDNNFVKLLIMSMSINFDEAFKEKSKVGIGYNLVYRFKLQYRLKIKSSGNKAQTPCI